ncbi:MAG: hypothetical protein IKE69_04655 [Thermoguttaceae bacterium]|nr:hypothetical protein [Thermoguttaceae bacterium]
MACHISLFPPEILRTSKQGPGLPAANKKPEKPNGETLPFRQPLRNLKKRRFSFTTLFDPHAGERNRHFPAAGAMARIKKTVSG